MFDVIGYILVTLVVFGKTFLPPPGQVIFGPDIWRYHYFQRPFLGNQVKAGIIPWWDPYILSGQPYLEQPQITTWYPPNLLFAILPTNVAVSFYYAFHIFWAMLGMQYLARKLVGEKAKLVAWGAGLSFGLSSYFVSRIYAGHMDIIAASSWMPWVLGAYVGKQYKRAAILFCLELISGHQMVAVYTAEAIGIFALVYSIVHKSIKPIIMALFVGLLGAGIAAIQILPNQQLISRSIRTITLPEAWSVIATPTPSHMLEFLDPEYFYSKLPNVGLGHEHTGYIGKVPLLLAVVAVIFVFMKRKKRPEVWTLCIIILFALWVWLGPNAPIDLFAIMRKFIPLYDQIRIPSRHIALYVLSMSALFAIGLSFIKRKIVQIIVIVLVLVDLVPLDWRNIHLGQIPEMQEDKQLISLLSNSDGLYRFLPNYYHGDLLREVLEFDAPIRHKLFSVSGYETPPLRNYYEFLLAINNLDIQNYVQYIETIPPFTHITSPYLSFLNIKYILTPSSDDLSNTYTLVAKSSDRGWRLYENNKVLPRFYFVQHALVFDNRAAVDTYLRQGKGDPRQEVFLINKGREISCASTIGSSVRVLNYQSDKIILETENDCDAYLVSSEVYYPGWQVSIDGINTDLVEGNLAFRTVFVPKGKHMVVMYYFPTIVFIGAVISLVSIGICLLARIKRYD